jgi:D-amino-acid dehydrogenase
LSERGMLMLCNTEHGLEEETRAAEYARGLGIVAEVLTPSETAKLEPNLNMTIAGSVYFPGDCHLMPGQVMAALARELEVAGVAVSYDTGVEGWRSKGDRIEAVRTGGAGEAELRADEYVVCGGIWSQSILRELGIRIPMQAGKGYSLTMETAAPLPSVCALLNEARIAVTPMGSALRFAGTMELGGIDESIHPARVRGMVKSIAGYFPDIAPVELQQAKVRTGLRPCSPDGLPYVGRISRFANLSVATGHAMMGMSLGPITGKLIAETLCGEPPSCSMAQLSPERYA